MANKQYFQYFPNQLFSPYNNKIQQVITNIIHRNIPIPEVLQNITVFDAWIVQDGQQPWIISDLYYGSPTYYWVINLCNNVIDPYYDWILTYDDFNAFLIQQYGSVQVAQTTIYQYEDAFGNVIDLNTYTNLPSDERTLVYAYDYWNNWNENKRQIKLIQPQYIPELEKEMATLSAKFK